MSRSGRPTTADAKRYLLVAFCFERGSLGGSAVDQLLETTVRFQPRQIRFDEVVPKRAPYKPSKHRAAIAEAKTIRRLILETEGPQQGPSLEILPLSFAQVVYWRVRTSELPPLAALHALTTIPGFNAGYCADDEDVFWQSEEDVSTYELHGKPHSHLPRAVESAGARIDLTANPGRRSSFPGMWLQSAWRMWFGGSALQYMPAERLLEFPETTHVEQLRGGAVFIQLYEDAFAYGDAKNRARQAAFRAWTGMDYLAGRAEDLESAQADPHCLIEEGKFDHGGNRRVTIWLDSRDNITSRSRAARKRILEYRTDRRGPIWSAEAGP